MLNNLESRRRSLLTQALASENIRITSYTCTDRSFNENVNAAHIPLLAQNEILIWNIRGNVRQSMGTTCGKMGILTVQAGQSVEYARAYKRMAEITAPDSAVPAPGWPDNPVSVENGYYTAGDTTTFFVGVGNVIDFIQIPYNVGWNV